MLVRERMKKEIKAVHLLEQLLQRCDPEEIENLFMLQLVLKEERGLLKHLANCADEDYGHVFDLYSSLDLEEIGDKVSNSKQAEHHVQFQKFISHFIPEEELEDSKEYM